VTQILAFIAAHMDFMWQRGRFRIVGSEARPSNGGDAWVLIESSRLRIRMLRDRSQLFLDLQPVLAPETHWYSIDLVRRLFTGHQERSAVLDESFAAFLEDNLELIEELFDSTNWSDTRSRLKRIRVQRAKEMFG
jgi:hypothetical protein